MHSTLSDVLDQYCSIKSDSKRTKSGLRADYDRTHRLKNGVIVVLSNDLDKYSNFSGGGVAQWASSRLLSEDPGSIPGTAIPPTRQGGCQVPRWGSEVMKRYLAGKSTVRLRTCDLG